MNFIIKTKNIASDESLRKVIEGKLGKLKKFLKGFKGGKDMMFDTFVDVERSTLHHRKGDVFYTEVKIVMLGKKLVAKAHGDNLIRTITEVKDELENEIKKYKTKIVDEPRRASRKIKKQLF